MLNLQELRAGLVDISRTHRETQLKDAREGFEARKDLKQVIAAAAACDVAELKKNNYTNGYRICASYAGWHVYVDINVEGFLEAHDERLATLLSAINAICPDRNWNSYDYPANKTRSFRLDDGGFSVEVCAKLQDDSQKCRRVVVGKKMEERDVFQFVCDGEDVTS